MIPLLDEAIAQLQAAKFYWSRGQPRYAIPRIWDAIKSSKDAARIGIDGALS